MQRVQARLLKLSRSHLRHGVAGPIGVHAVHLAANAENQIAAAVTMDLSGPTTEGHRRKVDLVPC